MTQGTFSKITVAIDFDDNLPNLISNACKLAASLGADLRLTHVVDPWDVKYLHRLPRGEPNFSNQSKVNEAMRQSALSMLNLMTATIQFKGQIETEVLSGDIVDELATDLQASGSDLIITGVSKSPLGEVTGLSKALDFAKDISLPVLILDNQVELPVKEDRLKLCIADDLGSGGFAALRFGQQMLEQYESGSLFHAFVDSNFDDTSLDAIHDSLEERARNILNIDEDSYTYHSHVCHGFPEIELKRIANATASDIVIFGHHQVLHKRSHRLGEISHKQMLQQNRGVLLVPEIHSVNS